MLIIFILMGNTTRVQLSETKLIGVILSSDLSWSKHINIVVEKNSEKYRDYCQSKPTWKT